MRQKQANMTITIGLPVQKQTKTKNISLNAYLKTKHKLNWLVPLID